MNAWSDEKNLCLNAKKDKSDSLLDDTQMSRRHNLQNVMVEIFNNETANGTNL